MTDAPHSRRVRAWPASAHQARLAVAHKPPQACEAQGGLRSASRRAASAYQARPRLQGPAARTCVSSRGAPQPEGDACARRMATHTPPLKAEPTRTQRTRTRRAGGDRRAAAHGAGARAGCARMTSAEPSQSACATQRVIHHSCRRAFVTRGAGLAGR